MAFCGAHFGSNPHKGGFWQALFFPVWGCAFVCPFGSSPHRGNLHYGLCVCSLSLCVLHLLVVFLRFVVCVSPSSVVCAWCVWAVVFIVVVAVQAPSSKVVSWLYRGAHVGSNPHKGGFWQALFFPVWGCAFVCPFGSSPYRGNLPYGFCVFLFGFYLELFELLYCNT